MEAPIAFLDAWEQLVGAAGLPTLPRRRGRKPREPLTHLLLALTFHVMSGTGTVAEHFFQLFGEPLATERARAAPWHVPVLRVSFVKVLELVRPLWLMLEAFENLVDDRQKNQFVRRLYDLMDRCVTAKWRSRSCPRVVRQPVAGWPRLLDNQSMEGPLQFQVR